MMEAFEKTHFEVVQGHRSSKILQKDQDSISEGFSGIVYYRHNNSLKFSQLKFFRSKIYFI